jgi:hypothetical protein
MRFSVRLRCILYCNYTECAQVVLRLSVRHDSIKKKSWFLQLHIRCSLTNTRALRFFKCFYLCEKRTLTHTHTHTYYDIILTSLNDLKSKSRGVTSLLPHSSKSLRHGGVFRANAVVTVRLCHVVYLLLNPARGFIFFHLLVGVGILRTFYIFV